MGRIKAEQPDEEELWLLSYADMMTLIACFFILMMAFANYDPRGFATKMKVVSQHFKKDVSKSSREQIEKDNEEIAKHPDIPTKDKISIHDGDLLIVFQGTILFEEQAAELSDQVKKNLDTMVSTIRSLDPNYRVLIEGHTDNIPSAPNSPFINNWSLSGTRAATVIEHFESAGFDPSKIVTVSYADTRPIAPMEDAEGRTLPENQKLNRRVVIKVIKPKEPTKMVKLGFGHYFKESTEEVEDLP